MPIQNYFKCQRCIKFNEDQIRQNNKNLSRIQPQVFLWSALLDIDQNNPLRFIQQVRQVTTTGFRIRANTVSQYALHGLTGDLYALDDPKLTTNLSERKIYLQIPHDLKQASKCLVSSISVIHKFDEQKVKLNQITPRIVNVSVRTDDYSQIDYIQFNILLGTDQSLWTSPAQALIIDRASNSPFLFYNRYNYFVVYYQDIAISFPQERQSSISVPMFMMRGYHNPIFEIQDCVIRIRGFNQIRQLLLQEYVVIIVAIIDTIIRYNTLFCICYIQFKLILISHMKLSNNKQLFLIKQRKSMFFLFSITLNENFINYSQTLMQRVEFCNICILLLRWNILS